MEEGKTRIDGCNNDQTQLATGGAAVAKPGTTQVTTTQVTTVGIDEFGVVRALP